MGDVFQPETVDEALLVICYPGIWIDPKPYTLNWRSTPLPAKGSTDSEGRQAERRRRQQRQRCRRRPCQQARAALAKAALNP